LKKTQTECSCRPPYVGGATSGPAVSSTPRSERHSGTLFFY
jgi:hypothetical protein